MRPERLVGSRRYFLWAALSGALCVAVVSLTMTQAGALGGKEGMPPLAPPTIPKPSDPLATRPQPKAEELPPMGIVDVANPFPSETYFLELIGWQNFVAGSWTQIYSGSFTADSDQGVILIVTFAVPPWIAKPANLTNEDGVDKIQLSEYPTPTRAGSVRVVQAYGAANQAIILKFASQSGETFFFSVGSKQFVRDPCELACQILPPPQ